MHVKDAITKRRTIRKYDKKKPSKELLLQVIDAGRHAPTACNYQNWHFVVVDDAGMLDKLHFVGAFHAKLSPVVIFVFYNHTKGMVNEDYQDHIQSASAAVMSMIYQAEELGLATNWVCDLPSERNIRNILHVPKKYRLICMLNIGYSAQDRIPSKTIKSLDEITSFNHFSQENASFTGMYQPGFKPEGFFRIRSWGRRFLVWLWLATGNDRWKRLIKKLSKSSSIRSDEKFHRPSST